MFLKHEITSQPKKFSLIHISQGKTMILPVVNTGIIVFFSVARSITIILMHAKTLMAIFSKFRSYDCVQDMSRRISYRDEILKTNSEAIKFFFVRVSNQTTY